MTGDDLLREARTMLNDLLGGWPVKELHRSPDELIEEITVHLDDRDETEWT